MGPPQNKYSVQSATWLRLGALVVVGGLLVALPLAFLLLDPIAPIGPASPVSAWSAVADPHFRGLLWTSVRLACWVTTVTLVVGVPYGLWLAWTRSRGAAPLVVVHLLPLCLPPYVTALAWSSILGRQGLAARLGGESVGVWTSGWYYGEIGVVLALAVALTPIVTLLTAGFARRLDASRVEAGLLHRGWAATVFRVVLPMAAPGIGAGALLVFVLVLGEVAVVQLLRVPVYATVVFGRLADLSFQPGEAMALALPMILLAVVVAAGLYWVDAGGRRSRGLRVATSGLRLRGGGFALAMGVVAVATAVALVPMAELVSTALIGDGGGLAALGASGSALWNSLGYAAGTATILTILAALLGAQWSERPRAGGVLVLPLLLGLVLPAGVYALALVTTWNRPSSQWLYRSDAIVILALCGRYAYVALRVVKLGRDQSPDAWFEAAELTSVGPIRRWWTIDLPLQKDILGLTWLTSFLMALRDLETTILFYPPGGESLPLRTMTLEANAPPGLTAAAATLQILVTLTMLIFAAVLWHRPTWNRTARRNHP
jgi:iron(III) transport system permease protein